MRGKDFALIFFAISIVFLMGFTGEQKTAVIKVKSITKVHFDGAWGLEYQYSVNGFPTAEYFHNQKELDEYKVYLKTFGRILGE